MLCSIRPSQAVNGPPLHAFPMIWKVLSFVKLGFTIANTCGSTSGRKILCFHTVPMALAVAERKDKQILYAAVKQ